MEDTINRIDGKVQVIFEKTQDDRTFRDALWMSESEYETTSIDTIEVLKQTRFSAWLDIVNAVVVDTSTLQG